ncbi:Cell fate regulator YaaT, PSP1 superfamily (controls sporulation, competence, biofilm development) [Marinitoga hydrogenitolerans DSM 16785]|uniref:Cell fate regulator YaaT, PSP1 superfamily (Controls sporulation, competence, biofilm development) n=1 Tax=Marinitoga hydrogenitolerans (strain DSM 16785 / JCM 12826 / AT1271) TaxID=1122195 RepID=A0A1M4UZN7_MARH1|nr:regulatory iron-sulfur-containing complex subunit RicT [Marinitoga hydrogenitolerans]SHE62097.1 Cell fate regulator YaaT, PSP1 superfamily (controls sporulation, competence, biofilm development) [Marinitoga hydrogenitolerans DSM 16785]
MINLNALVYGVEITKLSPILYYASNGEDIKIGDLVLVNTDMGLDVGKVVLGPKELTFEEIGYEVTSILRKLNSDDLKIYEENKKMAKKAKEITEIKAKNLGLPMRILSARFVFDKSKIIVYFGSDTRVDFRELVKDLAKEFKARIELRQIGIRDEVKMIGAIGLCGQVTCCSRFLRKFDSIKMEMAKTQQMLINTAKISGRCGRLMCCLAYENDFYESVLRCIPNEGSTIEYENVPARVITVNAFLKQVTLQIIENNQPVMVKLPFEYFKKNCPYGD